MKLTRENIKDLIYAITIVVGVLFFLRDEAKDEAVIETKLNILIQNDEKQNQKWDNQGEINGKFITLYDYFIPEPGPSEED